MNLINMKYEVELNRSHYPDQLDRRDIDCAYHITQPCIMDKVLKLNGLSHLGKVGSNGLIYSGDLVVFQIINWGYYRSSPNSSKTNQRS